MALLQNEIDSIIKSLNEKQRTIKSDTPKISIIVPVFNSEKYLSKCLFSLINQTEREIEIIVVDDGSTDDTEKIISIFAQYDARIIYIKQNHKLQGAARNNGIKSARGKYIGFVDSDDWVDLDYYEKMYLAAIKYNSDLSLATNVRTGNGKNKKRINIEKEEFITDLQAKIDACRLWKDGCPTNKIYKSELLTKNNILFPEGVYCEDKIYTAKALFYANGIVTVPNIYYYYYRNPNSTVKKMFKTKKFKIDKNKARLDVLDFLKKNDVQVRDRDFWAITKEFDFMGIPIYTRKESLHTVCHFIFSFIKIKEEKI